MKVTTSGTESTSAADRPTGARIVRLLLAVGAGFALIMLVVVLSQPQRLQRSVASLESRWGNDFYAYDRSLAEKWSIAIGSYLRNSSTDLADIPELVIDVPFKNMSKIYAKRDEALRIGNLIQGPDDFVNGEIRYSDNTLPIKLRLKGDWNDHLGGRKWSFRVHVRNGGHLFGMKRFSLQSPATRGFQAELLFFDVMRRFGVMAPRYQFVNVTLNGDSMGLMALEEFFAKEFVGFNRRREGVVVRFDESLVWRAKDSLSGESVGWNGAYDHYSNAEIDAIGAGRIAESPILSRQYEIAVGLLRGFVDETLEPSEVFDVKLSGRYLAIIDMFGAWHASRWPNVRFYLNPVTLKLEPIAYDANLQTPWMDERSIVNDEPLVAAWIADSKIAAAYRETLAELQQQLRSGELEAQLREVEAEHLPALQTEYRMLGPMLLNYLAPRTDSLLQRLNATGGRPSSHITWAGEMRPHPQLAHALRYERDDEHYLEVTNAIPKDVEVMGAAWIAADSDERVAILVEQLPIQLSPRGIGSRPERHALKLPALVSEGAGRLEVQVRLERRPWYQTLQVPTGFGALTEVPTPSGNLAEQLAAHEFLSAEGNQVTIKPGDWAINSTLFIPDGFSLSASAGTRLSFSADAALVVNGPVNFTGTAEAPVELRAATAAGWPGMVVMEADAGSELTHVTVRDTTSVRLDQWVLTGGVNFYASNVLINDCHFFDSHGEDALNIMQSEFEIYNSDIRGTASDAFDVDFSNGLVEGGLFADIGQAGGGDAIDLSGSQIIIRGTRFENVVDKALSVGEASSMQASTVIINSVGTGAAAKDGSQLTLSDSVINAASFAGLTAYIKKSEYGPARVESQNVRIVAVERPVLVQTGSVVIVDGVVAETSDVDVDALYETVMMPGLRQ